MKQMPDDEIIYRQALEITQNHQQEILIDAIFFVFKIVCFSIFTYLIIKLLNKRLPEEIEQNLKSIIFAMAILASVAQLPNYYQNYHETGIYKLESNYISTTYSCEQEICDSYDIFNIKHLTQISERGNLESFEPKNAQIACADFVVTRFVNRELKKLRHEIEETTTQLILRTHPEMTENLRQKVEKEIISKKEEQIIENLKHKKLTIITLTFGALDSFISQQNIRYRVVPYMIWDEDKNLIYQRNSIPIN